MLPAIDLDYHAGVQTHEINNKRPERLLAPELMPAELPGAKYAP